MKRQRKFYKTNNLKPRNILATLIFCFLTVSTYSQHTKKYTNFQTAIENIDSVFILDLSGEKLSSLPIEIGKLIHLEKLILKNNRLSCLPIECMQLNELESIDLSKNNFTKFPLILSSVKNLKRVILNRNQLYEIPDSIKHFKNLEYLDLWSNDISNIPNSIGDLKKLKELDLRVIMFSKEEKKRISNLLPNCEIHFSNSCNCGY